MRIGRTDRERVDSRGLRWFALSLSIALVTATTAACVATSAGGPAGKAASVRDQRGQRNHERPAAPASTSTSSAPATSSSATSLPVCGLPPCVKYLSRSQTHNLDDEISGNSIASEVALHLVVGLVCGGFLCDWGASMTFDYVKSQVHDAAQNHECLRVRVLPHDQTRQLVELQPTNQSPYCTG